MLEELHFVRPHWLWLLLPLSFLWVWLWRQVHDSDNIWHKVCDAHLLPSLNLIHFGQYQKCIPLSLLGMGWLLSILALAGPSWSKMPQSIYRSQQARVLILDLSSTMDIKESQISRLEQARYKIWDILNKYSQEGQTALVVFAEQTYIVSPLTDDANTIAPYVPALKTDLMRVQGKRTWLALQKSGKLLEQSGAKQGEILLITDEVDNQQSLMAAHQLRKQGHRLSILAVGEMPHSVPKLKKLATEGGGDYVRLNTDDDSDLNKLLKSTKKFDQSGQSMNKKPEVWQDQGYWLLFLLLPLAALSFRRGWLSVLLLCVIGLPQPTYAFSWNDLWQRSDQQVVEILAQGVAYYRAAQYEKAAAAFAKVDTAQGYYNLGNALVHLGEYEKAINVYQDALKKNPQYAAAKHNLNIVKKLLERQQSKQNPQKAKKQYKPKPGDEKKRTGVTQKKAPNDSVKGEGAVQNGQLITGENNEGLVEGNQSKDNQPKNDMVENEQTLEQLLENIDGDLAELLNKKFQHQAQPPQ